MENWVTKGLPEVLFIQEGPGIRKYQYEEGGYPMINVRCVQDGYIDMSKSKSANYELATNKWKHFQIDEGDILYTISGTIGRSAIVKDSDLPLLMNTSVVRFKSLEKGLSHKFVYYYFKTQSFISELLSHSTGTAIQNVGPSHLAKMSISFPPIPEQQRIVAILDQAFADIEKARANAERNLKNARELFDSYLNQVSADKKPLGRYVTIKTGKLNSNAATEDGAYPFFTCSRDVFSIDSYSFDCEAILLAGNNASGDFNVKHFCGKFDAYQRTYVITINEVDQLLYSYLYYQMTKSLRQLKNSSVGAGTKFLKIGMIQNLEISIPSISEQQRILDVLEPLKKSIEQLEKTYKTKIASLDELKKSLLQKAFSGELTKTEGHAA